MILIVNCESFTYCLIENDSENSQLMDQLQIENSKNVSPFRANPDHSIEQHHEAYQKWHKENYSIYHKIKDFAFTSCSNAPDFVTYVDRVIFL